MKQLKKCNKDAKKSKKGDGGMTAKRFINDIDIGQLIDTKGELSTIDYSDKVDFYELWEFLNKLNDEKEQLKKDKEDLINFIKKEFPKTSKHILEGFE